MNLAKQRRMLPLVSKYDIGKLNDLAGYLKLKNRWPVAKVNIPWVDMVADTPAFILKPAEDSNILADLLFL